MKRILTLVGCFIILTCTCFAQDVIVTKDSRRIDAIVMQVNVENIRYKHFDNPNGSTYMLQKSDVAAILYQNGTVETFETENARTQPSTSIPARTQTQSTPQSNQYQTQTQGIQSPIYPPGQTQSQRTTQQSRYNQYQDVVYLKNGSAIRGIIIEQVPNQSIKIETADGSVFVYQMDEIETLTKVPYSGRSRIRTGDYYDSMGTGLQSGFQGIAELGYQSGSGINRLALNFIAGYQINPYFSFGLGIGLRSYSDYSIVVDVKFENGRTTQYKYDDVDAMLIPIFADFRVNFTDNWISPYLSLSFGYSFYSKEFNGRGDYGYSMTSKLKGGFLFNPILGVSFKTSNRFAIHAGFGYETQRIGIRVDDDNWGNYENYSINSDAIGLVFGISF